MMDANHLSPGIVVGWFPITRKLLLLWTALLAIANTFDVVAWNADPDLFHRWLIVWWPIIRWLGHYIAALQPMSYYVGVYPLRFGFAAKRDLLFNLVGIDWLILIAGVVAMTVSVCIEFHRDGARYSALVLKKIAAIRRSYQRVVVVYVVCYAIFFWMAYTGAGLLYPIPLYDADIFLVPMTVVYFRAGMSIPVSLLVFGLAKAYQAPVPQET